VLARAAVQHCCISSAGAAAICVARGLQTSWWVAGMTSNMVMVPIESHTDTPAAAAMIPPCRLALPTHAPCAPCGVHLPRTGAHQ
jgi:hypothetical protein